MKSVKDLHNQAMDLAEIALLSKMKGDIENYKVHTKSALSKEIEAISLLDMNNPIEPTFSILYRSAATLALDIGENRLSEKLISTALSKNPPLEIAEELRDLLEQVNLNRHLELKGIKLEEDEIQMNLTGDSVGFGVVHSEEFLRRVDNTSKMLFRIVERKNRKPFREKGRINKDIKDGYEVFISVPRAASFSVTLKVGVPSEQSSLPGFNNSVEIIDEFMNLISLIDSNKLDDVKNIIEDDAYTRNFIALSKTIAPDGTNIKNVGFTTIRNGANKFAIISKTGKDIGNPVIISEEKKKVKIKGFLKFADATHGQSGLIKIVDSSNKSHQIRVPEGMMNDIVKPMWDSHVQIFGVKTKNKIELIDIQECEE